MDIMIESDLCRNHIELREIKPWFKSSTLPSPMRRGVAGTGYFAVLDAPSAVLAYFPSISSMLPG